MIQMVCKSGNINLRKYQLPDAASISQLFYDTIHQINSKDYSDKQIGAWAPYVQDSKFWDDRMKNCHAYVAESGNEVIGFINLKLNLKLNWGTDLGSILGLNFESACYLDCLYVHWEWQNRGVATLLLKSVEDIAVAFGLKKIITEASITARSFFERKGFLLIKEQLVEKRGVELKNFVMEKLLS
ncbi:MAG: GNAT family N-acetyltransferase [Oligoflexia bacterium]|nr:GNAT family N-acetyltransferase [Oligoflexia bacterium]